jgi:hypothetical protein
LSGRQKARVRAERLVAAIAALTDAELGAFMRSKLVRFQRSHAMGETINPLLDATD